MGLFGRKEEEDKKEVEEPQEEENEENTYETDITCDNCRGETTIEIPCGTKVKDFIKGKKCECCECILQEEEE